MKRRRGESLINSEKLKWGLNPGGHQAVAATTLNAVTIGVYQK